MRAGLENRVFVGNLAFQANKTDLRRVFSAIGMVRDVYTPYDTGKPGLNQGYAFVEMSTRREAERALTLNGLPGPYGRVMIVREAKPRNGKTTIGSAVQADSQT